MTIAFACLIVSLVLACLAAASVPSGRVGLFPAAFAFFVLSLLVGKF